MKHRILSNLARCGKCGQSHSPSPLVALPFEHSVFYHTHTHTHSKATLVHMYCMKCNITHCWYPDWKANSGKSKKPEHYSCVMTGGSFTKSGRQQGTSSAWLGIPANQTGLTIKSEKPRFDTCGTLSKFLLMNTLVRQILYKGTLKRNASKFWWCINKVCQKKKAS